jgi:hypothetical protein
LSGSCSCQRRSEEEDWSKEEEKCKYKKDRIENEQGNETAKRIENVESGKYSLIDDYRGKGGIRQTLG